MKTQALAMVIMTMVGCGEAKKDSSEKDSSEKVVPTQPKIVEDNLLSEVPKQDLSKMPLFCKQWLTDSEVSENCGEKFTGGEALSQKELLGQKDVCMVEFTRDRTKKEWGFAGISLRIERVHDAIGLVDFSRNKAAFPNLKITEIVGIGELALLVDSKAVMEDFRVKKLSFARNNYAVSIANRRAADICSPAGLEKLGEIVDKRLLELK